MRELTTSNTDADSTMETGVEERDGYYTGFNLEIFIWGGMVSPHTMHGEYLVTCICIYQ